MPLSTENDHFLICPLNWGMGHATRSAVLADLLISRGFRVSFAAGGLAYDFLKVRFPDQPLYFFHGYKIRYPRNSNMVRAMLLQMPAIFFSVIREHYRLKKLVRQLDVTVVISDNRFGLWHKRVKSIYITHQVFIRAPRRLEFAEPLLAAFHRFIIRKYDCCWIPDNPEGFRLSGLLSTDSKLPEKTFLAGVWSRFTFSEGIEKKWDLCIIISGPEPQRSIFEKIILPQIPAGTRAVVFRGSPGTLEKTVINNTVMHSHADDYTMANAIMASGVVISRPGYSTIMDLAVLRKKAVFIPTPGQTEQEYLGRYLEAEQLCPCIRQDSLNLAEALSRIHEYRGFGLNSAPHCLADCLDDLLAKL